MKEWVSMLHAVHLRQAKTVLNDGYCDWEA